MVYAGFTVLENIQGTTGKPRKMLVCTCTETQKVSCWFPNVNIVDKSLSTCFRPQAVEQFLDSSYMSKGYILVFYIQKEKIQIMF